MEYMTSEMDYVSVKEFAEMLYRTDPKNRAPGDILNTAHSEGWLEAQDIYEKEKILKRLDAARVLHLFIREKRGIKDLPDITGAEVLKDLYDCRKCVNHIAQVFLRGLIKPISIKTSGDHSFLIFDSKADLTKDEALMIADDLSRL